MKLGSWRKEQKDVGAPPASLPGCGGQPGGRSVCVGGTGAVSAARALLAKADEAASAARSGEDKFAKGYRRKDGCPVPDWFVDVHKKPVEQWKSKKEREISGTGGAAKRRKY